MFVVVWTKEQLDRAIETMLVAAEEFQQRALRAESVRKPPMGLAALEMRRRSQMATSDAAELQKHVNAGNGLICSACGATLEISGRLSSGDIGVKPHRCLLGSA